MLAKLIFYFFSLMTQFNLHPREYEVIKKWKERMCMFSPSVLISITKNLSFLIWQSPDNNSSFRVEPTGIFHPAGRQ